MSCSAFSEINSDKRPTNLLSFLPANVSQQTVCSNKESVKYILIKYQKYFQHFVPNDNDNYKTRSSITVLKMERNITLLISWLVEV
jgi:hypothetical protein